MSRRKMGTIMKNSVFAKVLVIVITIVTVYILISQIELNDIFSTLTSIGYFSLICGFILYMFSYYFRALRFHFLLNKEVRKCDLFNIICIHNMVNNILPARTGELSYVYFLKKLHNKTTGEGIATLSLARLYDIIAISLLFFFSILLVRNLPPIILNTIWILTFCLSGILIISFIFIHRVDKFVDTFERLLINYNLNKTLGTYLLNKSKEMVISFGKAKQNKNMLSILIFSILIWLLNYSIVFVLLSGMGVSLSFEKVILGSTFTLLTTTLPINGIAGFGTNEGFWVLVFVPLGLSLETAIITGFSYHILLIVYFSILGAYGLVSVRGSNIKLF